MRSWQLKPLVWVPWSLLSKFLFSYKLLWNHTDDTHLCVRYPICHQLLSVQGREWDLNEIQLTATQLRSDSGDFDRSDGGELGGVYVDVISATFEIVLLVFAAVPVVRNKRLFCHCLAKRLHMVKAIADLVLICDCSHFSSTIVVFYMCRLSLKITGHCSMGETQLPPLTVLLSCDLTSLSLPQCGVFI